MKNLIKTFIILFSILFVSCDSKTYEEVATVANPTYTKNIKPLFQSKCTTCHSPTATTDQEPYLTTSDEIKSAIENNSLECLIDDPTQCFYNASSIMPPTGRMPQVNIDMVKTWIANGYPN
jgi:cytochrome c5